MTDEDVRRFIAETAEQTTARAFERFHVVVEGLEHKVQLVDEGVAANTERIERVQEQVERLQDHGERVESEMHREFEEVRSMIRLSYTELDRRLRTLEDTVGNLQERMDRLESGSTQ